MSLTGLLHRSTRDRPAWLWAALAATVVLILASCGNDDHTVAGSDTSVASAPSTGRPETSASTVAAPETTSTTASGTVESSTPASSTSLAVAVHQEIVDSYVAYWDARFAANVGVPNPQDPGLARHATGRQLDAVVAETQDNLNGGRALRPAQNPRNFRRVTVVSADGDEAVVQECVVDDAVVVQRDTGAIINDAIATHNVKADLLRVDGQWKVSAATLVQRWDGVSGCALAS